MKTLFKTLLIFFFAASIGACNPLKVTDPADPNFDPDQFRFSDYKDRDELIDAFRKLFPVGVPKEFVDRVLVDAGGANCNADQIPALWHCHEPYRLAYPFIYPGTPKHIFIYDENMRLENIYVNSIGALYPDRLTIEKLIPDYKNIAKRAKGGRS